MRTLNFIKLILTISVVFLVACSKDDSCNANFLECYDGTVWTNEANPDMGYIRFNNNMNRPYERWIGCSISDGYYHSFGEDYELLENTVGKLKIKYVYLNVGESGDYPVWTYEPKGNKLFITQTPSVSWGPGGYLIRSSIDVDNLDVCN